MSVAAQRDDQLSSELQHKNGYTLLGLLCLGFFLSKSDLVVVEFWL